MKKTIILIISLFICQMLMADNLAPIQPDYKALNFRIMSFNVLQGWDSFNASETVGHEWLVRREPCVKMLSDINPDIVCVQEARKKQCEYFANQLPQYSQLLYPKDGVEENGGQRNLIMYKSTKFELLEWEKFWFSLTPDFSSNSWDAGTTKLTIRAKFRCIEDKKKSFWVYCTHFFPDPNGAVYDSCRLMCSIMMAEDIKANIPSNEPVFVCGDLNLDYGNPHLDPLLAVTGDAATSAPESDGPLKTTFNGFTGPNRNKTLDHIYGRNVAFKSYRVVQDTKYGTDFLSDHYPIYADAQVPVLMQDTMKYDQVDNLKLENKWFLSENEPYANVSMSTTAAFKRDMCLLNDTIYITSRQENNAVSNCFLDRYVASTGEKIARLPLSNDVKVKTYPCNGITKDDAGNLLVYNYAITLTTAPLKLFVINPATGDAKLVADTKTTNGTARMEHLAVKGDVNTGNFKVYIPVTNAAKVLIFDYQNGVMAKETAVALSEFYPTTATKFGMSPRIFMIDDDKCVINSAATHPTAYALSTGKILSSFADNTDNQPSKLTINGFEAFTLNGRKYAVYPTDDYTAAKGYGFNLAQINDNLEFSSIKKLWLIPSTGLGTYNNTNSEATITTQVNKDNKTADIIFYVPGNGLACYSFTDDNVTAIKPTVIERDADGMSFDGKTLRMDGMAQLLTVYNAQGQSVVCMANVNAINMNCLPKGLYIIKIKKDGKTFSKKVNLK